MSKGTLDCSDLDNYIGKPMTPWSLRDDLHNNDFRRWAQAMHYPNLLHYDDDFAARGRFGRLVAPQSFTIAAGEGHGACPAGIGFFGPLRLVVTRLRLSLDTMRLVRDGFCGIMDAMKYLVSNPPQETSGPNSFSLSIFLTS